MELCKGNVNNYIMPIVYLFILNKQACGGFEQLNAARNSIAKQNEQNNKNIND